MTTADGKEITPITGWFSITPPHDECNEDDELADFIYLCRSSKKCRMVESAVKNGKPMVVKIYHKTPGGYYDTRYFYKTKELCQKDSIPLKRKNDERLKRENKDLDKYR
jgi:hypothetical protein